ncbi:hypothetical protein GCM10009775_36890 [Microbacterium aoyamense]|uniref:Uncharacterized protein n=1 Tax=Microbacterium aoyamense TaxID=344166 RepID=A0ABN2Q2R3_9MICO|nr:hypothetical protein [Microbacterium aoyamense]
MSITNWSDAQVVRAINNGSIPSEDLISRDGWSQICRVRGRNFRQVDEESWQDLCSQRGYLQNRSNPRGF